MYELSEPKRAPRNKKDIYKYMAVTSLGGWLSIEISKIPSSIVKNGHEKPPPKGVLFFMFQSFLFFLIFVVFCPSFVLSPSVSLTSSSLKATHALRLPACIYIYIYTHTYTPYQDCNCNVQHGFRGGCARIVGFDRRPSPRASQGLPGSLLGFGLCPVLPFLQPPFFHDQGRRMPCRMMVCAIPKVPQCRGAYTFVEV